MYHIEITFQLLQIYLSHRRYQSELQKLKQDLENLTNRLTVKENESQELKSSLTASQAESKTLKQEHQALLEWKKEKETLINETEAVQKQLTDKIGHLENSLVSLNEANDNVTVGGCGSQYIHLNY